MVEGEGSSNNNEQMVKSEAFPALKVDEPMQDGSAQLLAEAKAHAEADPEDKQARELVRKLEQPESVAISPEHGGTGQRYGMDGKLHDAADTPSRSQEYASGAMPVGQVQTPVSDAPLDERNVRMAQAYAEKSAEKAVAEFPELAKVYAARAAMETQLVGRPPESREIVMARFDERAMTNIENGKLPALQINEKVTQEVTAQREHQMTV